MKKQFQTQNIDEAIVKFLSAKPFLNLSEKDINNLLFCFQGKKELVIACDDWVLFDKIKSIIEKSEFSFPPLKEIVAFLEKEEVLYYIDTSKTTKI